MIIHIPYATSYTTANIAEWEMDLAWALERGDMTDSDLRPAVAIEWEVKRLTQRRAREAARQAGRYLSLMLQVPYTPPDY